MMLVGKTEVLEWNLSHAIWPTINPKTTGLGLNLGL